MTKPPLLFIPHLSNSNSSTRYRFTTSEHLSEKNRTELLTKYNVFSIIRKPDHWDLAVNKPDNSTDIYNCIDDGTCGYHALAIFIKENIKELDLGSKELDSGSLKELSDDYNAKLQEFHRQHLEIKILQDKIRQPKEDGEESTDKETLSARIANLSQERESAKTNASIAAVQLVSKTLKSRKKTYEGQGKYRKEQYDEYLKKLETKLTNLETSLKKMKILKVNNGWNPKILKFLQFHVILNSY